MATSIQRLWLPFCCHKGIIYMVFLIPLSDQQIIFPSKMVMLWFKFILGLMFFELVSIFIAIFSDYEPVLKILHQN